MLKLKPITPSVMKNCTRALSKPIHPQLSTQFLEKDLLKEITVLLKTISNFSCLMSVTMLININTQAITSRSLEVSTHLQNSLWKTMKLEASVNGLAFQTALKVKQTQDHSLNNHKCNKWKVRWLMITPEISQFSKFTWMIKMRQQQVLILVQTQKLSSPCTQKKKKFYSYQCSLSK